MSYGESDYQWVIYDKNTRKSKKERKCCACGQIISIGHKYVHVYAVGDNRAHSFNRCLRCEAIFNAVWNKAPYDAISDTLSCGHTWEENFGAPPPPEVAELAFLTPEEAQNRFKG